MGILLQDLRYGLRMLVKTPGFTVVALITLALGIGANTAVFSLVNTILLRPAPFENADRLVRVFRQAPDGNETRVFSYLDYIEYRDRSDVFDEMTAYSLMPMSVGKGDGNEMRIGQIVTGNYFDTLGVKAIQGRVLNAGDDETPGMHPVTVISYSYWQRTFGGEADTVGKTITISGHPFTIVGVAPKGFAGVIPIPSPELWTPMAMIGQVRPEEQNRLAERGAGMFLVSGRLKSGLPLAQARAQLAVTASQLKSVDPERYEEEDVVLLPMTGIIAMTPAMHRKALAVSALVMSMVGLVLVVACANVTNLALARSETRRKEIGIRSALGAGGLRLVRQLVTENLMLALLGGTVGLALSFWTLDFLVACLPELPWGITMNMDVSVDWRILMFTLVASVSTGLLFGLAPALGAAKPELVRALKADMGSGGFGFKRSRLRSFLVVGQIAVSLVLLISAGLFVRSLRHAHSIDPGFEHENVLAISLDFGARDYDEASTRTFSEQLLEGTRALSGVASASMETCPPLVGYTVALSSEQFWIEGRPFKDPDDEGVSVFHSEISTDNFKTLGIPLLRGRDFTEQDTAGSPRVVIVNKAFADRYWPGEDPVGKRISSEGAGGPYEHVVGVVKTVKHMFIGEDPRPYIYRAQSQNYRPSFNMLLVRTSGNPTAVLSPVCDVIRQLDPNMSPMGTLVLSEMISFALLPARFAAGLFGLIGMLALLLASVGLYGVMSYTIGRRTREIGIRMALGAQDSDVVRLVLKQGLTLTVIGLSVGLAISFAATRVLSTLLYEIGADDPATFGSVSLILAIVALLACYIPARRATRVDPMVALRCE
jgi:predicted permease